jgi:hypothetical protein
MTRGRREHPALRVVFAMLAGGAPLLNERLSARGGPTIDLRDQRVFYDSSSYGVTTTGSMARIVGQPQLVFGSDRPVVDPEPEAGQAALQANGAQVIEPLELAA